MTVLVIADHDNAALKGATFNTVTAAAELGEVTILVAGSGCGAVAEEAAKLTGINKVLVADDEQYANPLAEVLTPLVIGMAGDYTHILASATTFGKNLLPRVAALLDVQQISEITAIQDADTFERPIYAG
ncbi:MAG: electron transfer flavoprotein subunit alpha/FixB family protein, partial [Rhodospirillaceae bacterium]|nr:electron transfer flavoprotein subunit alpha/FixB family protein [Rhodospirillaceae bacterium]